MSSGTIELKTDRLILRRHTPDDAKILYRNFGTDPKMFEYSGWNPYATEKAAEETVRRFVDSYEDEHFYGWAVEHEDRLIGTVGAYDFDPETDSIAAEGTFGEDSVAITFSYDEQRNVVWTENGESTVLEYSYLTD